MGEIPELDHEDAVYAAEREEWPDPETQAIGAMPSMRVLTTRMKGGVLLVRYEPTGDEVVIQTFTSKAVNDALMALDAAISISRDRRSAEWRAIRDFAVARLQEFA